MLCIRVYFFYVCIQWLIVCGCATQSLRNFLVEICDGPMIPQNIMLIYYKGAKLLQEC